MVESLYSGGKMNIRKNIIWGIAGVISSMVGITIAIPGFLNENNILGTGGIMLLVAGLVLLGIAFGEE